MLLGDSLQYKSKYCIAYFGNNKAKWYSTSNNTLLFCFIFVNKHRVLACDSLLTIETSKQEGNWHGRARGLRLLRWGIFLVVYLGDEWEGLKWLFSTLCLGRVMKVVFFKLAFVLHVKCLVLLSVLFLSNTGYFLMTWVNPFLSKKLFQNLRDHLIKVNRIWSG